MTMKTNENNNQAMSYFVHEGEMVRMERCNKRVSILCAVMAAMVPVAWSLGRLVRR